MEAAYRGRVNCMYDGGLDDGEVEDGCGGGDEELLQRIPDVRPHCLTGSIRPKISLKNRPSNTGVYLAWMNVDSFLFHN